MLWLALRLPDLPLAAHPCRPLPSVVVDRGQVIAADEFAHAVGILPGMRTATARGMLPELTLLARDGERERCLLDELACRMAGLTPEIVVVAPAALLLEIGGCLRLFGGSGVLIAAVRAICRQLGVEVGLAAAPTPLAALWLADVAATDDASLPVVVTTVEALPEALAPLPVDVTGAASDVRERLAAFGVRRLADLFALPRAGLARRLGAGFVINLERALGERPDPQVRFVFPEQFALRLELPGRVDSAPALAFAARRLLEALCGWLAARQAGAQRCALMLEHERGRTESRIELALAAPTRELERFERVLRERLERSTLDAPVEAIRLHVDSCEALPGRNAGLFEPAREGEGIEPLLERLRARLGEDAVHGLAPVADHRPECATRKVPVGMPVAVAVPAAPRPLWLLDTPESLPEIDGRPHRRGAALELLTGPERIESGWWGHPAAAGGKTSAGPLGEVAAEPGDVRRDYFVARTPQYECFWIFRDRAGWYLHGLFA
jgi:protein ImuB